MTGTFALHLFASAQHCLGRIWESYCTTVIEDGQEVELPASQYCIYMKEGPPEGYDLITYHLVILKQVVDSDAEVYTEAISDTMLAAILTDEEHDKLSGQLDGLDDVMATVNLVELDKLAAVICEDGFRNIRRLHVSVPKDYDFVIAISLPFGH